jgi:hypothetical protein
MTEIMKLNADKAQLESDTVFSRPIDIVEAPGLTRGQKIDALERWNQTLLDRIRATDEGMAPPAGQTAEEAATVQEISEALRLLHDVPEDNA